MQTDGGLAPGCRRSSARVSQRERAGRLWVLRDLVNICNVLSRCSPLTFKYLQSQHRVSTYFLLRPRRSWSPRRTATTSQPIVLQRPDSRRCAPRRRWRPKEPTPNELDVVLQSRAAPVPERPIKPLRDVIREVDETLNSRLVEVCADGGDADLEPAAGRGEELDPWEERVGLVWV